MSLPDELTINGESYKKVVVTTPPVVTPPVVVPPVPVIPPVTTPPTTNTIPDTIDVTSIFNNVSSTRHLMRDASVPATTAYVYFGGSGLDIIQVWFQTSGIYVSTGRGGKDAVVSGSDWTWTNPDGTWIIKGKSLSSTSTVTSPVTTPIPPVVTPPVTTPTTGKNLGKLMLLGDSITAYYYQKLFAALNTAGYTYTPVGSSSNTEGHAGNTIENCQDVANVAIPQYKPDFVVLMIGTNNNLTSGADTVAPMNHFVALVNSIKTMQPNVKIVIQSPPSYVTKPGYEGYDNFFTTLDSKLHIANVTYLNTRSGFTASDLDLADPNTAYMHPSASGVDKIVSNFMYLISVAAQ